MKVRTVVIPMAALAVTGAMVPGADARVAGNDGAGIHDTRGEVVKDCLDMLSQKQGTITWDGPLKAWPPNHKYRSATITATEESDPDPFDDVTVAVTGTHDELAADGAEMTGAGHTDPATDVVPGTPGAGSGEAVTSVRFRGERSGRGDGRVYTFIVEATFDNGANPCTQQFTVTVPHDMRGGGGRTKGTRKARALRRR